jgi:hypothetical protein
MLAHHFTQAGLSDGAIEWWDKLATSRCARLAFQEEYLIWAKPLIWLTGPPKARWIPQLELRRSTRKPPN